MPSPVFVVDSVGAVGEWCGQGWGCHLVWQPICVRVATVAGMAKFVSFCLRRSSVEGGATDDGSFQGVLHWETGMDGAEEVQCSHSKASWRCWFMAMVMAWGVSILSSREWVSTGMVVGT